VPNQGVGLPTIMCKEAKSVSLSGVRTCQRRKTVNVPSTIKRSFSTATWPPKNQPITKSCGDIPPKNARAALPVFLMTPYLRFHANNRDTHRHAAEKLSTQ
jgi:hypothetical protein